MHTVLLSVLLASCPAPTSPNAKSKAKIATPPAEEVCVSFALKNEIEITFVKAKFDPKKFKVDGCTAVEAARCVIDGAPVFGTAGAELPNTYVKKITVSYHGKEFALDTTHMFDAGANRFLQNNKIPYFAGRCETGNNCQLRALLSDAGGAYVAEWIVANGIPFRTVLTDSGDITSLFIEHLDPPEYD